MVFLSRILVLLIHVSFCSLSSAVPWISATRLEHPVKAWMATFKGGGAAAATVPNHQKLVEEEIASPRTSYEPRSYPSNVADAANDFDARLGQEAYQFLYGLASSQTFVDEFWHKKPLLLRNVGEWVKGAFTVEKDLKLIGGSFIAGHRTADVVRNGTDTTTCHFCPIKDNPARPTTWEEVEEALKGGTIYFNTAGSLWPNLGEWGVDVFALEELKVFVGMSQETHQSINRRFVSVDHCCLWIAGQRQCLRDSSRSGFECAATHGSARCYRVSDPGCQTMARVRSTQASKEEGSIEPRKGGGCPIL